MSKSDLTGERHRQRLEALGITVNDTEAEALDGLPVTDVAALICAAQQHQINLKLVRIQREITELITGGIEIHSDDLTTISNVATKFATTVAVRRDGNGSINTTTKRGDLP